MVQMPYAELGGFTIHKAYQRWYWIVEGGRLPIEAARELYADPVGKTDIRVAGHCGCPPPEKPWTSWLTPYGKEIYPTAELKKMQDAAERSSFMRDILDKAEAECIFNDDPASVGKEYVCSFCQSVGDVEEDVRRARGPVEVLRAFVYWGAR